MGERFTGRCIFEAFRPHTVTMDRGLPDSVEVAIAVHRDGVSRLRSVYDHRIRREKEAPEHGLDHFARHLPEYCKLYPKIAHHCCAQSSYLGSNQSEFTDIVPLSRLEMVRNIVTKVTGELSPPLPRIHETGNKSAISDETAWWFSQWTAHDTALGWNGETLKLFPDACADEAAIS